MEYTVKFITVAGNDLIKFLCPQCGNWLYITEAQYEGFKDISCNCGFLERIDLS